MLPYIVVGLTSGAVYALAGLGLVLTYKTSGVFNFAQGALATVSAYVFYALYVLNGWSWVTGGARRGSRRGAVDGLDIGGARAPDPNHQPGAAGRDARSVCCL